MSECTNVFKAYPEFRTNPCGPPYKVDSFPHCYIFWSSMNLADIEGTKIVKAETGHTVSAFLFEIIQLP